MAIWLGAIALISIQNITPISLKFLVFESIQLPMGILLAISVGVGMVFGATIPIFWQLSQPTTGKRWRQDEEEDPLENWQEE